MRPQAIRALRDELGCTARELATALGLDQKTVLAWEQGELFPTKRFVERMEELRKLGPSAIPRRPRRKPPATPLQALADPEVWTLVRKLLAHPELRQAALDLAKPYADPIDDPIP